MPTNAEMAAQSLINAAEFFESIARGNKHLAEQMLNSAEVFRQVAELVAKAPLSEFGETGLPDKVRDRSDNESSANPALPEKIADDIKRRIEEDPDLADFLSGPIFDERSGLTQANPSQPIQPIDPVASESKQSSPAIPAHMKESLRQLVISRLNPDLLDRRPVPFAGEWHTPDHEEMSSLLTRLCIRFAKLGEDPWPLTHEKIALRCTRLPFAPQMLFCDTVVLDRLGTIGHGAFLAMEHEVFPLSTGSAEVHDLCGLGLFKLSTEAGVAAYLRFFCWVVCGNDGPFNIVEDSDRIDDGSDPQFSKFIDTFMPSPVHCEEQFDGSWKLRAIIRYSNELFAAAFVLQPSGEIEMNDDDPMISIPVNRVAWHMMNDIRYVSGERA